MAIFGLLIAGSAYMYWRAQQNKVDAGNVNDDWDETTGSVLPADLSTDPGTTPDTPARSA